MVAFGHLKQYCHSHVHKDPDICETAYFFLSGFVGTEPYTTLWSAFQSNTVLVCRFTGFRVNERPIRVKKYAVSKISGFV